MALRGFLIEHEKGVNAFVDHIHNRLNNQYINTSPSIEMNIGECVCALDSLIFHLFNVRLCIEDSDDIELMWNPFVVKTCIRQNDPDGVVLGYLYFDINLTNTGHSCHHTIRSGCEINIQTSLYQIKYDQFIHSNKIVDVKLLKEWIHSECLDDSVPMLGHHMIEYGARIHCYLVAKAIARLVFKTLIEEKEPSLVKRDMGLEFRKTFIEPGGERDPHKMISEYFKKPVTVKDIADSLLS
ncbi:hypothetical protein ACOME3_006841 [Neoechinorhynchus agilis]